MDPNQSQQTDSKDGFIAPLPPTSSKRRVTFAADLIDRRDSFGQQQVTHQLALSTPKRTSTQGNKDVISTPNSAATILQQRPWNIESPASQQKHVPKGKASVKRQMADEPNENLMQDGEEVFGTWS